MCLWKPHLEHISKPKVFATYARKSLQEGMSLPFVFPKTRTSISGSSIHMQREASVSISDRYLRICFKPRAYVRWNFDHHFLKETTLRTCMCLYFTFQYTCAESFSGVACENIDGYLFFCMFFCKPTFYFLCFLSAFPWGSLHLELFFLVALSYVMFSNMQTSVMFLLFSLASTLTC